MKSTSSEHFRQLSPLVAEDFDNLSLGSVVWFVLLEHLPAGGSTLFSVEYLHREIEYRSPGKKGAVAHGQARLDCDTDYREVRILFSSPNKTATLRGLVIEGQVKSGRIDARS